MSHFTVLVIGEDWKKQLAPYQGNNNGDCPKEFLEWVSVINDYDNIEDAIEDGYKVKDGIPGYWENPNRKWDWYNMGGRWNGFFKLKENCERSYPVGSPGVFGNRKQDYTGRADQCLKGDVDFQGMMQECADKAAYEYELLLAFYGGEIPKIEFLWETIIDGKNEKFKNMSIDEKRKFYWEQPAFIKKNEMKEKIASCPIFEKDKDFLEWHELQDFQCPKEQYVLKAKNAAFITFAFVKDSKWFERGEMGWWGCVSNEMDTDKWQEQFVNAIMDLPDNTLLTVVDCHI